MANANSDYIVSIVGPTATGKTATGILVAEQLNGEIISADSISVYRGMDIGTAKPSAEDRMRVKFHGIDIASPDEQFDAARFCEMANSSLMQINERGSTALLVGGTGLYVKSFLEGFNHSQTPASAEIRSHLEDIVNKNGLGEAYSRLQEVDPVSALKIHFNDKVRILRALEVFDSTGRPISEWQEENRRSRRSKPSFKFGIHCERDELNRRIDLRVDEMIENGIEAEVSNLLQSGFSPHLASMRSVGYKQMAEYLHGMVDLKDAIESIKLKTRQLAKRQWTWFKADPEIVWIDGTRNLPNQIAESINQSLGRSKFS